MRLEIKGGQVLTIGHPQGLLTAILFYDHWFIFLCKWRLWVFSLISIVDMTLYGSFWWYLSHLDHLTLWHWRNGWSFINGFNYSLHCFHQLPILKVKAIFCILVQLMACDSSFIHIDRSQFLWLRKLKNLLIGRRWKQILELSLIILVKVYESLHLLSI